MTGNLRNCSNIWCRVNKKEYFSPISRRKIFAKGVKGYTEKMLSYIPEFYPDIEVVKLNVQEDHIHMVVVMPPRIAVAATKSVIEQTLFYDLLFRKLNNIPLPDLNKLGNLITQVLEMPIPKEITKTLINSQVIYFAGRNNGVAEELTLKANEIARKKSDFLEGTYVFHGIEEVMDTGEVVVIIDPFKDEEEVYKKILIDGIGLKVVAISTRKTIFPTIIIPGYGDFNNYIEIAAGWNLLVEVGINMGVNLDKTIRARKVGHEFKSIS